MQQGDSVVTTEGRVLRLGGLLGRGGEAAAYDVVDDPALAAKIYHHSPPAEKLRKLEAMVSVGNAGLREIAAWPIGVLAASRGGRPVGVLMPKVVGSVPLHVLCSPKSRKHQFPEANWRFLIRTASNLARAFERVHGSGQVIGDVNNQNVLISRRATSTFIDCDSFQISAAGTLFRCTVGTPTYTPPELQGTRFSDVDRSEHHDNFGLAVLTFQLLFMGCHPFAGRSIAGPHVGIEDAIVQGRFAYGADAVTRQMQPPPTALPLEVLPTEFRRLFHDALLAKGGRPPASRWREALDSLERGLQSCRRQAEHLFPAGSGACPWCTLEPAVGMAFFVAKYVPTAGGAVLADLHALWASIEVVRSPGPSPSLPTVRAVPAGPCQAARRARQERAAWKFGTLALGAFGFVMVAAGAPAWVFLLCVAGAVAAWKFGGVSALDPFWRDFEAALGAWRAFSREWEAKTGCEAFDQCLQRLHEVRRTLEDLPNSRAKAVQQLHATARERQLNAYLDALEIEDAHINGIGQGRTATLISFGIETAADITSDRLANIPGFGPKLRERLLEWRAAVEARFSFDPSRAIDPNDVAAIDRDHDYRRQTLVAELRDGPRRLAKHHEIAMEARAEGMKQARPLIARLSQAMADVGIAVI